MRKLDVSTDVVPAAEAAPLSPAQKIKQHRAQQSARQQTPLPDAAGANSGKRGKRLKGPQQAASREHTPMQRTHRNRTARIVEQAREEVKTNHQSPNQSLKRAQINSHSAPLSPLSQLRERAQPELNGIAPPKQPTRSTRAALQSSNNPAREGPRKELSKTGRTNKSAPDGTLAGSSNRRSKKQSQSVIVHSSSSSSAIDCNKASKTVRKATKSKGRLVTDCCYCCWMIGRGCRRSRASNRNR